MAITLYDDKGQGFTPAAAMGKTSLASVSNDSFDSVAEVMHLFATGYAAHAPLFNIQAMCYDFARDRQWLSADLAHFEKMRRLPITINIVKSKLRRVSGLQRQNRTDIPITPVDSGGDQMRAEWAYKVLRHLSYINRLDRVGSRIFENGLEGLGTYHIYLKPGDQLDPKTGKPTLEVKVEAAARYSTVWDPTFCDPLMTDCDWLVYSRYMTEQRLTHFYPAAASLPFDNDSRKDWYRDITGVMKGLPTKSCPDIAPKEDNTYLVMMLERRMQKLKLIGIDRNTGMRVADYVWEKAAVPFFEEATGLKVVEYPCDVIHQKVVLPYYYAELEKKDLPYSSYSLMPFAGERFNSPLPECTSYLYSLLGLQREKNISRSNQIEAQNRALRGGYKIRDKTEMGEGEKLKTELDQFGHQIGRNYNLVGDIDIEPMQAPEILQGTIWREEKAEADMEEVSSVSANSTFGGVRGASGESGIRRQIRNDDQSTALFPYFDDMNEIEAMVGGGMLDRFAAHCSAPYALTVLGENPADKPETAMLTPEIMARMRDVQKFDVRIKEGPFSIMKRQMEQEERMILFDRVAACDPLAGKGILPQIIRGTELPDAQELAADVEATQAAESENPPAMAMGAQLGKSAGKPALK